MRLLDITSKVFSADNNEVVKANNNKANETIVNWSNKLKKKRFRNLTRVSNILTMKKPIFLTFNAKKAVNYLRQAFIKVLILQHFDPKYYI